MRYFEGGCAPEWPDSELTETVSLDKLRLWIYHRKNLNFIDRLMHVVNDKNVLNRIEKLKVSLPLGRKGKQALITGVISPKYLLSWSLNNG